MTLIDKNKIIFIFFFFNVFYSLNLCSADLWKLDPKLSELKLELPMLMADNISSNFNSFKGYIYIDDKDVSSNEFILSIDIDSLDLKESKLKNLLLDKGFFNSTKYPLIVLKILNFKIEKNSEINAFITIKNNIYELPVKLSIIELTKNLRQIKIEFKISRKLYKFEKNKFKSNLKFITQEKSILLDNFKFNFDLFITNN